MEQRSFTETLETLSGGLLEFDMIFVEGGTLLMGGADPDAYDDEKPVHKVRLPGFFISKYPVTQALWKAVLNGDDPSYFKGDLRPVEQVSWVDIAERFLPELIRRTDKNYRLPTETEWEYAVRGGKYSEGYLYAGSDKLSEVGWYKENSGMETREVGLLYPNELGIFDMSGNVWEWVEDHWHDHYKGAPTDGSAWLGQGKGAHRVYRGGYWGSLARVCRASYRYHDSPGYRNRLLGFRLTLSFQADGQSGRSFP